MWRPETRVVAAVSGGADSVALLLLLRELHGRGALVLDCAAHLNHQIRGEAADADEAFCRALAGALGLTLVSERVDVPALARERRQSIEVAGREARLAFLEQVRASRGADRIATAHTADDQAETMLLRLVRGTGTHGLAGIAPRRAVWVRPCLEFSHAELCAELRRRGQTWREDATNVDLANPRNRIRREVVPLLERHFNPSLRGAIRRFADIARSDAQALQQLAQTAADGIVSTEADRARLDAAALTALPEAVARRVVRIAIERLLGGASPGLDDVEAVLAIAAGTRSSTRISSLVVEPSAGFVVLVPSGSASPPPVSFRFDLPIPGEVHLPSAGWTLQAEGPISRLADDVEGAGAPDRVRLDAAELGAGLVVRSRQPGDRLRPLGVGGRKKVQDVLVDRKVPRGDRDSVPIVTDRAGRIVWVAGHVLGEEFRVSGDTNTVVILKLRRA
jgi:tRNA(Ile)-lysidine synthase